MMRVAGAGSPLPIVGGRPVWHAPAGRAPPLRGWVGPLTCTVAGSGRRSGQVPRAPVATACGSPRLGLLDVASNQQRRPRSVCADRRADLRIGALRIPAPGTCRVLTRLYAKGRLLAVRHLLGHISPRSPQVNGARLEVPGVAGCWTPGIHDADPQSDWPLAAGRAATRRMTLGWGTTLRAAGAQQYRDERSPAEPGAPHEAQYPTKRLHARERARSKTRRPRRLAP